MTTETTQECYRQEAFAHFLMLALDPTDDVGIRRDGQLDAELMGCATHLYVCYCPVEERVLVPSKQLYIQWAQEFLAPDSEWSQILHQQQQLRNLIRQVRTAAQQDHGNNQCGVSEEELLGCARQHTVGFDEVDASTFVAYYVMERRHLQEKREQEGC